MRSFLATKGVLSVRTRALVLLPVVVLAATAASSASASQLINRGVRNIQLAVDNKGEALVSYRTVRGRAQHVLAWGAMNARQPNRTLRQYRFKLDYAGGWGKYHKQYWTTFRNSCGAYDGPALPWLVTACKAPDGSYCALQKWQDWTYSGRFHRLFGRFTYLGKPVYGFGTTHFGAPTDGYGRLIYIDTYNSAYGSGWRRENSFVSHNPTGVFCYGFFQHNAGAGGYAHPPGFNGMRPMGNGDMYRLTAAGPGVTPDVMWSANGLHNFNARNSADVAFEAAMNAQLDSILNGDRLCRQH